MPFERAPELPSWLAHELPWARRSFVLERGDDHGRRLHLIDAGRGRPLLFVHGNPTWCFLWRKVIRLLDLERYRAVAPDLLGLGLSSKPRLKRAHTLTRHVDAITELVEALDLRDVVLVGQDWGGPIAAGVGARLPDRISGVVLGNTSVLVPRRPRGTAFHRFARAPLISELVFQGLGFPQRLGLPASQGDPRSMRGAVGRAYRWPLRRLRDRAAPLALARMVPSDPNHPSMAPLRASEAWLRSFTGPMAFVWGERDPILGHMLERHVQAFPQASVRRTQAGHFLQEEVPEEIAAAIEDVARVTPEAN